MSIKPGVLCGELIHQIRVRPIRKFGRPADHQVALESVDVANLVLDREHDRWIASEVVGFAARMVTPEQDFIAPHNDPDDGHLWGPVGVRGPHVGDGIGPKQGVGRS